MSLTHQLIAGICSGLLTLLTLVLIRYLSNWQGVVNPDTGDVLMRYNLPTRIMGVTLAAISVGFPVLMTVLIVMMPPKEPWEYVAAVGLPALAAAGGLYVWRETRHGYAIVSAHGIKRCSPWHGTRFVNWGEITRVVVGPSFVMTFWAGDVRRMWFPVYWTGLASLYEIATQRLTPQHFVFHEP